MVVPDTNMPPKGHRSETFYWLLVMFIFFHQFSKKSYDFTWKLSKNKGGSLQNIFKSHFGFKTTLESQFLDLKTDFWMFRVHFWTSIFHNSSIKVLLLDLNAYNESLQFLLLDLNAHTQSTWKAPLCLVAPCGAFVPEKWRFLEIWNMPIFRKCVFPYSE